MWRTCGIAAFAVGLRGKRLRSRCRGVDWRFEVLAYDLRDKEKLMAWLERNRPDGPYQLVVRYGTQRLKRSTRTTDARRANEIALRADRRLEMLECGELPLPDDVDVLGGRKVGGRKCGRNVW